MVLRLPKLVIYGAGGHGKVVADITEKSESFTIAGFIDNAEIEEHFGYKVLGKDEELSSLKEKGIDYIFVAIGNAKIRKKISENLIKSKLLFATIIHPSAQIGRDSNIGQGTVVMPGAVIGPNTRIGDGCVINTCASVDHDSVLDDYVQIAPGAHLGGKINVGQGTFVGIGSCIKDKITLGKWSVIGAGSAVVDNVPDFVVSYGLPAKVIREIND
jgi:UDP-perosamine 4-acetyltransferase